MVWVLIRGHEVSVRGPDVPGAKKCKVSYAACLKVENTETQVCREEEESW